MPTGTARPSPASSARPPNGRGAVGVAYETELVGYRVAASRASSLLRDIRDAIGAAAIDAGADVDEHQPGHLQLPTASASAPARFRQIAELDRNRGRRGPRRARHDHRQVGRQLPLGRLRRKRRPLDQRHPPGRRRRRRPERLRLRLFELRRRAPGLGLRHARAGGDDRPRRRARLFDAPTTPGLQRHVGGRADGQRRRGADVRGRPGLGWRDVQSILAASARQVGSEVGERPGAPSATPGAGTGRRPGTAAGSTSQQRLRLRPRRRAARRCVWRRPGSRPARRRRPAPTRPAEAIDLLDGPTPSSPTASGAQLFRRREASTTSSSA